MEDGHDVIDVMASDHTCVPGLAESERLAALLKTRPQPIDYGLTYDDLHLYDTGSWNETLRLDDGSVIQCLGTRPDDKYKEPEPKRAFLHRWRTCVGKLVGQRASPSPGPNLITYWLALLRFDKEKGTAETAVRKAVRDAELRKRSYWTFLDGYGFERATAEVLNKHQFNAVVTRGSADGGIDIEVTRNGLRGVVQCKAHMACVGPHVVRDLYGVIHHTRASFGIIVSLGGFTKGAFDFRRDKPILFVDLDDLIAMQEGKDVLADAFSDSLSATPS